MNKKIFLIVLCIILSGINVFAEETNVCSEKKDYECPKYTKCIDLMTSMYTNRAASYNVLNLSNDQQKCKDVIDKKRYEELGQQVKQYEQEKYVLSNMRKFETSTKALKKQGKIVKNLKKSMQKTEKKYDKEFKSILDSEQKTKLNAIRKMEKKEIKYCQKGISCYKRDPKLRPFGEKMYEENNYRTQKKFHMFNCKNKISE